ncbi:C10 family peptidase [candidate division KSB1 bacterium]|nr:C10 family peptidase [candidate division KSB1 bacterium]
MRKTQRSIVFIILFVLLVTESGFSERVGKNEALQIAQAFISRKNSAPVSPLRKYVELSIREIDDLTAPDSDNAWAYIASVEPRGFIVISADTRLEPIIAYSLRHDWKADESSGLFRQMLIDDLKLRNEALQLFPDEIIEENNRKWQRETQAANLNQRMSAFQQWPEPGTTSTGGWIETTWHQSAPYNDLCPTDSTRIQRNFAGCVATAMAQIANYHQSIGNVRLTEGDRYATKSLKIRIDEDSTKYDFPSFETLNAGLENIKTKYLSNSLLTDSEAALLNFTCAILLQTDFNYPASGARVSAAAIAFKDKLGYQSAEYRYPGESFYPILRANMMNGFPALLSIYISDAPITSAHSIIADGYNTDGFYHLNFGWGSTNPDQITDAWCLIPEQMGANYNMVSSSVLDIKLIAGVRAQLEASTYSLTIPPTYVGGSSDIQTLTLTNNSQDSLTINFIKATPYFSVSIAANEFADSLGSITLPPDDDLELDIVFQPDSIGIFKGNIHIYYCDEREYLTIQLSGHGVPAGGTSIIVESVSGTWHKAGSPYYICCDITVPAGEKLEIGAGTSVFFTGSCALEIGDDAQLVAKGTETDSIFFQAYDINKGWSGIHFKKSGRDDTLSYCVISGGQTGKKGGALYISSSALVICHSRISHNHAAYGGAISTFNSSLIISDLTLSDNSADFSGGAFYIDYSSAKISNATICNNIAENGGAFYIANARFTISNSAIFHNQAEIGGAISVHKSLPHLLNVTIAENEAFDCGGALNLAGYNNFEVKNSVIWANKADSGATLSFNQSYPKPDTIEFAYSNIDTFVGHWLFKEKESSNNRKIIRWSRQICEDPCFKNPEMRDFSLKSTSPCIDSGDPNDNILEEPFPHGYCINMGAYGGTPKAACTSKATLTVTPDPFDFDVIELNSAKRKACYLKNGSPSTININEIQLSDSLNFSIKTFSQAADVTAPILTLNPREIDSLEIRFAPTSEIEQDYIAYLLLKMDECPNKVMEILARAKSLPEYNPIPLKPQLVQNYPNPFNAATVIEYRMHRDDKVKFIIYNVLGKRIRILEDKAAKAGLNRIVWDGKDDTGKIVSSGIYFYQMRTGYYRKFRRMVLVR